MEQGIEIKEVELKQGFGAIQASGIAETEQYRKILSIGWNMEPWGYYKGIEEI